MVDALREAQRVLTASGILIDVRPVPLPIIVEIVSGAQTLWSDVFELYSAPEDIAAADAAVHHALSRAWLHFDTRLPFDFEIYCDTAADLSAYVKDRKLCGVELPYEHLDHLRHNLGSKEESARLRCRRPWMLSTYRAKSRHRLASFGE